MVKKSRKSSCWVVGEVVFVGMCVGSDGVWTCVGTG